MDLVLDEPKANDEKVEVEGLSFVMNSDVADTIRSYGNVAIDYKEFLWMKGFQLSLGGESCC